VDNEGSIIGCMLSVIQNHKSNFFDNTKSVKSYQSKDKKDKEFNYLSFGVWQPISMKGVNEIINGASFGCIGFT